AIRFFCWQWVQVRMTGKGDLLSKETATSIPCREAAHFKPEKEGLTKIFLPCPKALRDDL
ncbi:MAG: hypothetical protein ACRYFU_19395, partial [Janthinobacterium lividum]